MACIKWKRGEAYQLHMTNAIVIPIQSNESKAVKNMPIEIIITEEETSKEVIAKSIFESIKILLDPT